MKLPFRAGRSALALMAISVAFLAIGACGQKGALYLPERNGTVITRPAGERPADTPSGGPGAAAPAPNVTEDPTTGNTPAPTPDNSGIRKNQDGSSSTPP